MFYYVLLSLKIDGILLNNGDIDKAIDLLNRLVRYVASFMERPTGKNKMAKSNIINNWFDKEFQTTKYNVRNN